MRRRSVAAFSNQFLVALAPQNDAESISGLDSEVSRDLAERLSGE
jgi:hypothetical protein